MIIASKPWPLRWWLFLRTLGTRRNGVQCVPPPRPIRVETVHYTLDGTRTNIGDLALCGYAITGGVVADHASTWQDPSACPNCLAEFYRRKELNGNVPLPVR